MRLFTAVWPPDEAVAALAGALAPPPWHPAGHWRPVPPVTWHLTLCFHGDDDPDRRAGALDVAFAGVTAPRLRFAGLGTFPGVVWAGVDQHPDQHPDQQLDRHNAGTDQQAAGPVGDLRDLAARAGADPSSFRAHLTLARRARGDRRRPVLVSGAALGAGPWWRPAEVLLVRSDPGPRYTPIHRVVLGR